MITAFKKVHPKYQRWCGRPLSKSSKAVWVRLQNILDMYKNMALRHTTAIYYEVKGCISMYPNEGHAQKSKVTKRNTALKLPQVTTDDGKGANPPGVETPPEEELSPAQLG